MKHHYPPNSLPIPVPSLFQFPLTVSQLCFIRFPSLTLRWLSYCFPCPLKFVISTTSILWAGYITLYKQHHYLQHQHEKTCRMKQWSEVYLQFLWDPRNMSHWFSKCPIDFMWSWTFVLLGLLRMWNPALSKSTDLPYKKVGKIHQYNDVGLLYLTWRNSSYFNYLQWNCKPNHLFVWGCWEPVSYTHLTLPTILRV